jgi:hypothetical protein
MFFRKLKFWMNFIITEATVLQLFTYLTPWNLTQKPVVSNLDNFCSLFGIWSFCYYACFIMITNASRRFTILSQMNPVHSCTSQLFMCVSVLYSYLCRSLPILLCYVVDWRNQLDTGRETLSVPSAGKVSWCKKINKFFRTYKIHKQ